MEPVDFRGHVFINCPYDDLYDPIFQAIVFTVHACGLKARCAKESADGGEARIAKICRLIEECPLAIHDLSRVELSEGTGLPRFNMPFELGLYLGARKFGGEAHRSKACLILDAEGHRYRASISDIAGQDIEIHEGRPEVAIRAVRHWLDAVAVDPRVMIPSPSILHDRYNQFRDALPSLCRVRDLVPVELSYLDFQRLLAAWLSHHNEMPRPKRGRPRGR